MKNLFVTIVVTLLTTLSAAAQDLTLHVSGTVLSNYDTHAVIAIDKETKYDIFMSFTNKVAVIEKYYGGPLALEMISRTVQSDGVIAIMCKDVNGNSYKIAIDTDTSLAIHDYKRRVSMSVRFSY